MIIINLFFWKKAIGDIHIAGVNNTLCGRPMLGNNYATQKEHFATCSKCVEVMEENDKLEKEKKDGN
jgi:hypothetical protein